MIEKTELINVTEYFLSQSTPGKGSISYEEGYNYKQHQEEKQTAIWLLDTFGGEIVLLKEKNCYRMKNPDYKWNSKFWELKHLKTKQALDDGIRKSCIQIRENPGGIIIDIYGFKYKNAIFETVYNRLKRTSMLGIFIIVKNRNKLLYIYEYKKRS